MAKNLIIRDEVYEYPETGDINYGEEASNWAEAVTNLLSEVSGPGDIPTTEIELIGTNVVEGSDTFKVGNINKMVFDTTFVQKVDVSGFILRTFTDNSPNLSEYFDIKGIVTSSSGNKELNISVRYTGDDAELEFDTDGGQLTFKYKVLPNEDQVRVKFKATAIVDETFFEE